MSSAPERDLENNAPPTCSRSLASSSWFTRVTLERWTMFLLSPLRKASSCLARSSAPPSCSTETHTRRDKERFLVCWATGERLSEFLPNYSTRSVCRITLSRLERREMQISRIHGSTCQSQAVPTYGFLLLWGCVYRYALITQLNVSIRTQRRVYDVDNSK